MTETTTMNPWRETMQSVREDLRGEYKPEEFYAWTAGGRKIPLTTYGPFRTRGFGRWTERSYALLDEPIPEFEDAEEEENYWWDYSDGWGATIEVFLEGEGWCRAVGFDFE